MRKTPVFTIVVVVVVFLTLTDPLRIQPWSQDRRNQTRPNWESEVSRESRQKRADKNVASKGHNKTLLLLLDRGGFFGSIYVQSMTRTHPVGLV